MFSHDVACVASRHGNVMVQSFALPSANGIHRVLFIYGKKSVWVTYVLSKDLILFWKLGKFLWNRFIQ